MTTGPYEIGFGTPEATRDRAKALATAFELLYLAATEDQKARIAPRKAAWSSYFQRLLNHWSTAFLETGEIEAYEREFAELRFWVESQGTDVSKVPAIRPAPSRLEPLIEASQNASNVMAMAAAIVGVVGLYFVVRSWTQGSPRWR